MISTSLESSPVADVERALVRGRVDTAVGQDQVRHEDPAISDDGVPRRRWATLSVTRREIRLDAPGWTSVARHRPSRSRGGPLTESQLRLGLFFVTNMPADTSLGLRRHHGIRIRAMPSPADARDAQAPSEVGFRGPPVVRAASACLDPGDHLVCNAATRRTTTRSSILQVRGRQGECRLVGGAAVA